MVTGPHHIHSTFQSQSDSRVNNVRFFVRNAISKRQNQVSKSSVKIKCQNPVSKSSVKIKRQNQASKSTPPPP